MKNYTQEIRELEARHLANPIRISAATIMIMVVAPALFAATPKSVRAQVQKTTAGLEVDCTTTLSRERGCLEFAASSKGLWAPRSIVCDAAERTAGRCPDTIATDQSFPIRKAQHCVAPQDLMSSRGRCLYARGPDVATAASLPACAAADFGYIALVVDEEVDHWCNGSAWAAVAGQEPGRWRASVVQCGAGPEHDVWPDGGPLPSVDDVAELPVCSVTFNNSRAWVGASNRNYPHETGTLWRCRDPGGGYAWEVNVPTYRETTTDANIATVCRAWQNNGRTWNSSDPFWIPPPFTAADSWLGLQADDVMERYLEFIILRAEVDGLGRMESHRNEPGE